LAVPLSLDTLRLHCVGDSVREHRVLVGAALFLQIIGDSGRDSVACDLLGAFASVQNKWKRPVFLADGFEELDAVPLGHIVVGDDTVDVVVS
jgi:hypothetical protein